MSSPVRVFLIGECKLVSDALANGLNHHETVQLVGSTTALHRAPRQLEALAVDAAVIHAGAEGDDIVRLIRDMKESHSPLKIVVLGGNHGDETIVKFIEAGAGGYAAEQANVEDVVAAIEAVQLGRTTCSPRIIAAVFNRICRLCQAAEAGRGDDMMALSTRQREILEMIARGLVNKEIGQKLGIAVCTVKNHVHNILGKLRVPNRRAAVRLCRRAGMPREGRAGARP